MACKICFFDTKKLSSSQFDSHYDYCPHCQCIALEERLWVSREREKKQYDQHQNSLENEGYVKMFEDFLDFFWKNIPTQNINVLDFGSGPTPVLSLLLQKRGALTASYDKFYQPKKVFKNCSYDLITSTEVFEHLTNPVETLSLLAQHLKPHGYIALMTLFHTNSIDDFWNWWYRRDPTHIIFFTPKTLDILAKQCGLELVKTDNKRIALLQKQ